MVIKTVTEAAHDAVNRLLSALERSTWAESYPEAFNDLSEYQMDMEITVAAAIEGGVKPD